MSTTQHTGRVLVVDDSPLAVALLQNTLQAEKWQVTAATTTQQALDLARSWQPDVVVSDLHMPDMDGLAFFRQLRGLDPTIPLVMTSSDEDVSTILEVVHAGVYDYVPKTSDNRVLAAAVARAGEYHRALLRNADLARQLQRSNQDLERRVTERTAQLTGLNNELQALMAKLVATERLAALGQLAAGVAHEINNPLAFVVNNLGYVRHQLVALVQQDPTLERLMAPLSEAEDGAMRIGEIVRDIRTVSRSDNNGQARRFEVNAAMRSATRISGEQIKRRAHLEMDLGADLWIMGNPGRITQVFINLLVNAADACQGRPGCVIRIVSQRAGDNIVVSVHDSGAGIPSENMARIFEPFFTTKGEGVGTGLGLSICRDIVSQHGGGISVTSVLGEGTRFTMQFPAAQEPA